MCFISYRMYKWQNSIEISWTLLSSPVLTLLHIVEGSLVIITRWPWLAWSIVRLLQVIDCWCGRIVVPWSRIAPAIRWPILLVILLLHLSKIRVVVAYKIVGWLTRIPRCSCSVIPLLLLRIIWHLIVIASRKLSVNTCCLIWCLRLLKLRRCSISCHPRLLWLLIHGWWRLLLSWLEKKEITDL